MDKSYESTTPAAAARARAIGVGFPLRLKSAAATPTDSLQRGTPMDISSIGAALSSTKALIDLVKTAVAARDDAKLADALQSLKERVFDIQNAALQTQEKMSAMQDQVQTLKDEKRDLTTRITELERRRKEREQYALCEIHPGSYVLQYRSSDDNAEPAHYICQPCMDNAAKKVVLQIEKKNWRVSLVCNVCDATVFTGETYTMPPLDVSKYR